MISNCMLLPASAITPECADSYYQKLYEVGSEYLTPECAVSHNKQLYEVGND